MYTGIVFFFFRLWRNELIYDFMTPHTSLTPTLFREFGHVRKCEEIAMLSGLPAEA